MQNGKNCFTFVNIIKNNFALQSYSSIMGDHYMHVVPLESVYNDDNIRKIRASNI